jgi:hypothetical protein
VAVAWHGNGNTRTLTCAHSRDFIWLSGGGDVGQLDNRHAAAATRRESTR